MKAKKNVNDEFSYLAERAKVFLTYLDENDIRSIFPLREKAWNDLNERVKSGSIRRIKILNNIIDDLLIGKSSLCIGDRYRIIDTFSEKLHEDRNSLIEKKIKLFKSILSKGIIDSNLMINDAIAIQNSEILGLTQDDKNKLKEIIRLSIQKR